MSYTVIEDEDRLTFLLRVNSEISRGWQPLGGVQRSVYGFSQALTFKSRKDRTITEISYEEVAKSINQMSAPLNPQDFEGMR